MDLSEPRSEANCILSPFNNARDDSPNSEASFRQTSNEDDVPERNEIMKPTEDLLASELSKLSLQARSRAMEDLHCVGDGLEETAEMMEHSLEEFDRLLKQGNYPMYDLAAQQNSAYVEDTSYRLMFLRANLYDVSKSVHQLVNHLQQKAKYFGEHTLGRNITLDDLNKDDLECLLSGRFNIQADTDPIGRSIFCGMGHLVGGWDFESAVRSHYYMMFNVLLQSEEVQKKGLVIVYYDTSKQGQKLVVPSIPDLLKLRDYRTTIPMRYTAMHFCLKTNRRDNLSSNNMFLRGLLKTMSQYVRVRARVHYGSDLELQYSLGGYGIQLRSFPVDSDGNIRSERLNAWFFQHLKEIGHNLETAPLPFLEQTQGPMSEAFFPQGDTMEHSTIVADGTSSTSGIAMAPSRDTKPAVQPLVTDVLLGRGVALMQHPGNVRFRESLETYQDDYDRAPRNKRRKVSKEVVRILQQQGVRFLERNTNGDWVEADAVEGENKVGQLFRSRRKLIKKS